MAGDGGNAGSKDGKNASAGAASQCIVCSAVAEFHCSGCRLAAYCCREHQKMDWKSHKNACKPYEVQTSPELGRHLVASRDLQPGDLVLTELPLIWGPKATADPDNMAPCVGCYRPVNLDVGERCASCGWPICTGHCPGLKDMRHHGLECPVLSLRPACAVSNLGDYYRHDALLTLRCLLSQTKFMKRFNKVMELQSHIEDRNLETETYQEANEYVVKYLHNNFLRALKEVETQLNTKIAPDISDKLLHTICGIIDVNALDLRLNLGTEISALFSQTCLMEHSCFPNTKHSFDIKSTDESSQFKITVKTVLPIKKGEHITTMYSHALWGTQARREHLKETKYFDCFCVRCKDPTELGTYLSALRCIGTEKVQCGGTQLPENSCDYTTNWCCDKCDVKIKNDEVVYLISKMGEEVENVQANGPTVKQLEDLITKLSTFLHPNHYHLYSVKHSLVQLYGHQQGYLHHQMSDEILNKKAAMCKELIDVTSKIDPGNSRLNLYSGVLYLELFHAKFQLIKNKMKRNEITKNDLGETKSELIGYLKIVDLVLEDESEGSAGQKLLEVMKESEKNLIRWINEV